MSDVERYLLNKMISKLVMVLPEAFGVIIRKRARVERDEGLDEISDVLPIRDILDIEVQGPGPPSNRFCGFVSVSGEVQMS